MTDMQTDAADPGRLVVGHPFNPPCLIPLVEVVGGERTAEHAVAWASRFYEGAGKSVITMKREVPGFIANRLQEALWREALHMVANGDATVREIDDSITEGPGLRWAFMGPMLTFALAGGDGGMAHMLDHFGPSLKSPWTRLEAPELDKELYDAVVPGARRRPADAPSPTWSRSGTRCDPRTPDDWTTGEEVNERVPPPPLPPPPAPDRAARVDRLQRPHERGLLRPGLRVRDGTP